MSGHGLAEECPDDGKVACGCGDYSGDFRAFGPMQARDGITQRGQKLECVQSEKVRHAEVSVGGAPIDERQARKAI